MDTNVLKIGQTWGQSEEQELRRPVRYSGHSWSAIILAS